MKHWTLLSLALWSTAAIAGSGWVCGTSFQSQVLVQEVSEFHQLWEMEDTVWLHSERLPTRQSLQDFRKAVIDRIEDVEPYRLLKRQTEDFERSSDSSYRSEAENPRLAFEQRAGKIRPIQCLEASLLSIQLLRKPMIEEPTEFGAYFLRKEIKGVGYLRVYYSTMDFMGLRGIHPVVKSRIEKDLTSGWKLFMHLHNHPFDFRNPVNFLGTPSPGLSDVQFYRSHQNLWKLESARVTNGFHTIEIDQDEFFQFRSVDDLYGL